MPATGGPRSTDQGRPKTSGGTHVGPYPHPASPGDPGRRGRPVAWWALALPVLAFVALLLLILNPADARAAAEQPATAHLLERLEQLTVR